MILKYIVFILVFVNQVCKLSAYIQVGIIVKKGEENAASIVDDVLKTHRISAARHLDIRLIKEIVDDEDVRSYHRAFCRLLSKGILAFISSAQSTHYSILSAYSHEYEIPFIAPTLPEETSDVGSSFVVGIRPSTTRVLLNLLQLYRWKNIVYLYDHEYGPEKLQLIFVLGLRALNLELDGILKIGSAEEANRYLRKLDRSFKHKHFHVILDLDSDTAGDIIWRHVNDVHVRKKNFHFVLTEPILDGFWTSDGTIFGAINVTTFTISNQLGENHSFFKDAKIAESILPYYYYDAALVLLEGIGKLVSYDHRIEVGNDSTLALKRDCLQNTPVPIGPGASLARYIKQIYISTGATRKIKFDTNGQRRDFDLNVTQITFKGYHHIGIWSNGVFQANINNNNDIPTTLPLLQNNNGDKLSITTIISPPFMMLKSTNEEKKLEGNDRFEGYCKDMLDFIANELNFQYEIKLVEDNQYGKYNASQGRWTGIIGELITGKADIAVADLIITGKRQRVVQFTDPYETIGFSILMKNPKAVSRMNSVLFFMSAFTGDVWLCILFTILIFIVLFHFITKYTGAPDSIESASGIWGRKHALIVNLWFSFGSSVLQGTGVYPRSISSRILSGVCWFCTVVLCSLYIASITAQTQVNRQNGENSPHLSQLMELSLESIILESVTRGWPKIGIINNSNAEIFIKMSSLPTFEKYAVYLDENPDVVVNSLEEGLKRVRESQGDYMLFLESLTAQYAARQVPCDLIATHDSVQYAGYGIATPYGSQLIYNISAALNTIESKGVLGTLYKKWWIDASECKRYIISNKSERTIHVFSGLLCLTVFGFVITSIAFAFQYTRKNKHKESRRQQLSFEDMHLGQNFPTPPPELLAEPAPVLNLPEYEKRTLL